MKTHVNIPVFIPHLGCPNQCVFCNQRTISGVGKFDPNSVIPIIEEAIASSPDARERELAFFGGSFTGIEPELMETLLNIGNRYLKQGRITSIRCSTRPDYINEAVLYKLAQFGVRTVELGLQSCDGGVLDLCKRGHTFADEKRACELLVKNGFIVGGQMMIGLPGSTRDLERQTAQKIVELGCTEARIYPTVVFRDTELYDLTVNGTYKPLDISDAILRSADAFSVLVNSGVKVLRVGLCDSENLHSDTTYYAGPNHPAMGELVENEYYYRLISDKLGNSYTKGMLLTVFAPVGHTSKVIGQCKANKSRILRERGLADFKVRESDKLHGYSLLLKIEERI